MTNQEKEKLLAKLRQPIHIGYISQYLLKLPMEETQQEIDKLISEGLVEESKYAKKYYVIKNQYENLS
jgi:hypothetical protein